MHAAVGHEHGLVNPGVTFVPALQARRGPEVVLVVVARAFAGDRGDRGVGVLDHAEVLHEDVRAVVGVDGGAHVEASEAVGAREDPVRATGAHLAVDALAGDLSAHHLEDRTVTERTGADRHGLLQDPGESELVDELHVRGSPFDCWKRAGILAAG
jgi:hypothetical protein